MKKIAAFLATFLLVLSLTACKSGNTATFSEPTRYETIDNSSEVTMSVKENSITDKELYLLITNHTKEEKAYGMEYMIEQQRDGSWYEMDGEFEFNSLAQLIFPDSTNEFHVTWKKELPKGKYRVLKYLNGDGDSSSPSATEFEIS